jgi:hypothetical protein
MVSEESFPGGSPGARGSARADSASRRKTCRVCPYSQYGWPDCDGETGEGKKTKDGGSEEKIHRGKCSSLAMNRYAERKFGGFFKHKYSTSNFKISHRKLNMLGRQISGRPIDHAILQMMFSEKRASRRVKSMLVLARDHALRYKGLDHSKLVVCA